MVIIVDHMVVDDVSMDYEVDVLANHDLNGQYWQTDISADDRCGDMLGIEMDAQNNTTHSMRKCDGDASSRMPQPVNFALSTKMDI